MIQKVLRVKDHETASLKKTDGLSFGYPDSDRGTEYGAYFLKVCYQYLSTWFEHSVYLFDNQLFVSELMKSVYGDQDIDTPAR
jgi:hypothetical protein